MVFPEDFDVEPGELELTSGSRLTGDRDDSDDDER